MNRRNAVMRKHAFRQCEIEAHLFYVINYFHIIQIGSVCIDSADNSLIGGNVNTITWHFWLRDTFLNVGRSLSLNYSE